ncbi:MAG: ATP synthase F1 subunit delta [Bacteroidales bacterium]|nr:ATP synthase F1 subunit delta [Bacteroidales bacterium]
MKGTKLAGRYAKAFFEFALELNQIEEVFKDISLINNAFISCNELTTVINSPIVRTDKKLSILNAVFQKHVAEITLRYLTLILKKRRELHINTICNEFIKLYKSYKNIITVEIFSASELEKNTIESIKDSIKKYTNADVETIEHIQPKLIGGVSYKFNDYYIDASVKTQLAKLKKALMDKSYEPNF